jgi:hypothetical protein
MSKKSRKLKYKKTHKTFTEKVIQDGCVILITTNDPKTTVKTFSNVKKPKRLRGGK